MAALKNTLGSDFYLESLSAGVSWYDFSAKIRAAIVCIVSMAALKSTPASASYLESLFARCSWYMTFHFIFERTGI